MKYVFCLILLLFLHCAIKDKSIYETITLELSSKNNGKTIAVLPFETNKKDTTNIVVLEKLTHELVKSGTYQVIERSKIDSVLKEQSLLLSGIISEDVSIKIGKLLSADGVVVGSIIEENQYTTIITRIVDTESGKIWSSSRVSYLTTTVPQKKLENGNKSFADNDHKPIISSEKPKVEIKDFQLLKNGKFGRFIGLLKNESNSVISGSKLYINLKDKNNNFIDTTICFTEKPAESNEEVPFSCILADFPSDYKKHEILFEPESKFYGNYTKFKIISENFKESTGGLDGYTLTGVLKNDTESIITYPKIILSLFDQNKKFLGSAIGFGNQKKLSPNETTSFKVNAYSYSLGGKPQSYKIQTYALTSSIIH
ncbi:MAG: hypothetical protein IPL26_11820 [Leptospiraceae bacterium]|nr:hypothetical protein [Leptospiraceae bacterium]